MVTFLHRLKTLGLSFMKQKKWSACALRCWRLGFYFCIFFCHSGVPETLLKVFGPPAGAENQVASLGCRPDVYFRNEDMCSWLLMYITVVISSMFYKFPPDSFSQRKRERERKSEGGREGGAGTAVHNSKYSSLRWSYFVEHVYFTFWMLSCKVLTLDISGPLRKGPSAGFGSSAPA